jgi:hypothetical protein
MVAGGCAGESPLSSPAAGGSSSDIVAATGVPRAAAAHALASTECGPAYASASASHEVYAGVAEDKGSCHSVLPSGLEYAASWAVSAALTEVVRAGESDSLCCAILRHTADAALSRLRLRGSAAIAAASAAVVSTVASGVVLPPVLRNARAVAVLANVAAAAAVVAAAAAAAVAG